MRIFASPCYYFFLSESSPGHDPRNNVIVRNILRCDCLQLKPSEKFNAQRIQNNNGSPLSKKLPETPAKPTPPTSLPGVRPFDHNKGLDQLTPGQCSTPTSSDDSPDLNTYKRMLEKPPLIKRLAMGLSSVHSSNSCSNEDWYPLVCSSSVSSSPSTNSDDCNTPESSNQEKLKDHR